MKKIYSITNGKAKNTVRRRATELLDWIVDFLPAAIPKTLDQAILDESGEVHALFGIAASSKAFYKASRWRLLRFSVNNSLR